MTQSRRTHQAIQQSMARKQREQQHRNKEAKRRAAKAHRIARESKEDNP